MKGKCQRYRHGDLSNIRAFSFFCQNIFLKISRICERELSAVLTRCPEVYVSIFVFLSEKFYFNIFFLDVAAVKGRYQRCQRGAQKSMRTFSFFGPNFFSLISRTGEREVVCGTNAVF